MPRATTVEEAENLLQVFLVPVWHWPEELKRDLPPFEELFVPPPPADPDRPLVMDRLLRHVQRTPRVKALLTGQKGSGKSWVLRDLGGKVKKDFRVAPVSLTDATGLSLTDADVRDLFLLIAAELAPKVQEDLKSGKAGPSVPFDEDLVRSLEGWAKVLADATRLPPLPAQLTDVSAELSAWIVKLGARIRSDHDVRQHVKTEVPLEDLVEIVSAFLRRLSSNGRPVLILLDDGDKLKPSAAMSIFAERSLALARLPCSMVLTFPPSLNFDPKFLAAVGGESVFVLRNVPVIHQDSPKEVTQDAVEYFGKVLDPLFDVGSLMEGGVLVQAVLYSAGNPLEFGRVLREIFTQAAIKDAPIVTLRHFRLGRSELSLGLNRATQNSDTRARLRRIRQHQKLEAERDYELLNANLVMEYVNHAFPLWYDVHPLLVETVESWGPGDPGAADRTA